MAAVATSPSGDANGGWMSPGRRHAVRAGRTRLPAVLLTLLGAAVAAVAWVVLVLLAVHLGRDAHTVATWLPPVVATTAAVVCLLLVFALAGRSWAVLRGAAPRHSGGKRRR